MNISNSTGIWTQLSELVLLANIHYSTISMKCIWTIVSLCVCLHATRNKCLNKCAPLKKILTNCSMDFPDSPKVVFFFFHFWEKRKKRNNEKKISKKLNHARKQICPLFPILTSFMIAWTSFALCDVKSEHFTICI